MDDVIMQNIIHENCKKQRMLNQAYLKKNKRLCIKEILNYILLFFITSFVLFFVMWLVAYVEL